MRQLIFVVDDDMLFSQLLAAELEIYGYMVRTFATASDVTPRAAAERPRLVLLGVTPHKNGSLKLYHRFREHPTLRSTPIILISAGASEAAIYELELGADGYMTKPVSSHELIVSVKKLLGPSDLFSSSVIRIGVLEIDNDCMTVSVAGRAVFLTTTEFRLLQLLARNPGRPFARKELLHALWPGGRSVTPRSVDSHIWRLREKVEPVPKNPVYLQTIHGQGYCFVMPSETDVCMERV